MYVIKKEDNCVILFIISENKSCKIKMFVMFELNFFLKYIVSIIIKLMNDNKLNIHENKSVAFGMFK